jgi:hypothetical protein
MPNLVTMQILIQLVNLGKQCLYIMIGFRDVFRQYFDGVPALFDILYSSNKIVNFRA